MCGRGRQNYAPAALFETARRDAGAGSTWKGQENYKPTENLCPGKHAAVVVQAKNDGTPPQLQTKRWGLVAAFDKSLNPDFWRMFNARSETLHTSPVFRRLLCSRRCAVPFDGFWEWTDDEMKAAKAAKQPWYVHRKAKGEPLWLAGLYDRHDPFGPVGSVDCDGKVYEGAELETFTLVTMDVDKKLAWLHDRQPVILDTAGLAAWLAPPPGGEEEDEEEGNNAETPKKSSPAAGSSSSSSSSAPSNAVVLAALKSRVPCDELQWHPTTKGLVDWRATRRCRWCRRSRKSVAASSEAKAGGGGVLLGEQPEHGAGGEACEARVAKGRLHPRGKTQATCRKRQRFLLHRRVVGVGSEVHKEE